jgi:hypothetical protein
MLDEVVGEIVDSGLPIDEWVHDQVGHPLVALRFDRRGSVAK